MAFDSVPWLVGGGAEHSPEVGRLLAHAATGGSSGIVDVADLRVQAQPTPGNSVRIAPGSAIIPNSWSTQQAYLARNATETSLTIPATDSTSGRSDLLVVRIDDPQYAGQPPADPKVGPYVRADVISGVSATATKANVSYPHIVLARLDIPASTATITDAMITDLRKVAVPKRERVLISDQLTAGENDYLAQMETPETWPNIGYIYWRVDIPEWATHAYINYTWGGVNTNGNIHGWVQAALSNDSQSVRVETPATRINTDGDGPGRHTAFNASQIRIPESLRGYEQARVMGLGWKTGGTGDFYLDGGSVVSVDIEFVQRAD